MTTIQSSSNASKTNSIDSARGNGGSAHMSLLPAPSSANPATMLAILQVECLSQTNEAAEKSREAYDLAEAAADKARINEMNKKNTENLIFGIAGAAGSLAQGGLGIASGIATASTAGAAGAAAAAEGAAKSAAESAAKSAAATAQGTAEKLRGVAGLVEGSVKISDTFKAYNSGNKDAHIAEYEQLAKGMKRASDQISRAIDARSQTEGKVRELIGEIVRGQDQCERAALFRSA